MPPRIEGSAAGLLAFLLACPHAGAAERSTAARAEFQRLHPCPQPPESETGRRGPCPGYVVDHIRPLACGGPDTPANMQWQTVEAGKAKDRTELYCNPEP